MSFTLAHPATVVFIKSKYLNLSGLILGSMAPDFIYFIMFSPSSHLGHTFLGAIILNMPLCFLLNFLYYKYIKNAFILNLPNCVAKYYTGLLSIKNRVTNVKGIIIFAYSSLIGMGTHVLWDSFTHNTGYFVLKLNFFRSTIDLLGHEIYIYKVAQHGGTLLGFFLIFIFLYKIRNIGLNSNISVKNKAIYHTTAILIEAIVILSSYIFFYESFGIGRIVVTFINGLFLGYLVASIIYEYKKNTLGLFL